MNEDHRWSVECGPETGMRQAAMTAEEYSDKAFHYLEEKFGEGFVKNNLGAAMTFVAGFVQAAAADYAATSAMVSAQHHLAPALNGISASLDQINLSLP